jgi:hypothetical protein
MKLGLLKSSLIALSLTAFVGCGQNTDDASSRLKIIPADRNAKNVALIIGSPNDLPGVAKDIAEVSKMLRESNLGYEIKVVSPASASQALDAASEVGKLLSANSTVFFYYSGHGAESGVLIGQGYQTFRLKSVVKRLGDAAPGGKFKRFIAVMDSCFSGQNVDGNESMFMTGQAKSEQEMLSTSLGMMTADLKPKSNSDLPFEQALVVAASQRNQTSLDFGSSIGGAFTSSWRKMLKRGFGSNQQYTLSQLLEESKSETRRQTGGSHTPVWKAMPENILTESLSSISPSPQTNAGIFMALGEVLAGDSMIFASLPANMAVGTVELCRGDKVACSSGNGQKLTAFISANEMKIPDRQIYRAERHVLLAAGDVVTAVVRDASGRAIDAIAVKLTAR